MHHTKPDFLKKGIPIFSVILFFISGCSIGKRKVSYIPLLEKNFSSREKMATISSETDLSLKDKGYILIGNNLKIEYLIESCRISYKSYPGFLLPQGTNCEKANQNNLDNFDIEKEAAKRGADLISDLKSDQYTQRVTNYLCVDSASNNNPPRSSNICMHMDAGYDSYLSKTAGKLWRREESISAEDEMVFVKGGCFKMGDAFGDGYENERPGHEVCVDDFYTGKYEVTVGDFKAFIDSSGYKTEAETGAGCYVWKNSTWREDSSKNWKTPGFTQTDQDPVVCVSWKDANKYIEWQSNIGHKNYRLLTEAEWEYAARSGGKNEKFSGGNDINSVAWYNNNSKNKTHPAGQSQPNGLGIYDMTGNVWEWTNDWHEDTYYKNSPKDNPKGPLNGENKVLRGGSWYDSDSRDLRVTYRGDSRSLSHIYSNIGFRLAVSRK